MSSLYPLLFISLLFHLLSYITPVCLFVVFLFLCFFPPSLHSILFLPFLLYCHSIFIPLKHSSSSQSASSFLFTPHKLIPPHYPLLCLPSHIHINTNFPFLLIQSPLPFPSSTPRLYPPFPSALPLYTQPGWPSSSA